LTIAGFGRKKYAMTRPHLIAKLILATIGIHFLLHAMSNIISIAAALNPRYASETISPKIFFVILKLLFAFAVSLILLFRSDWLVQIIAGPDTDQCEKVSNQWITAGFRIITCFCGLLIIYHRMELLLYYAHAISTVVPENQSSQYLTKILAGIFVEIIEWIIAIYLIFGAPHYTAWQVRTITDKQPKRSNGVDKYEQK